MKARRAVHSDPLGRARQLLGKAVRALPYVRRLWADLERFRTEYPPGHYYSPIPSVDEVRSREDQIFSSAKREILGVDLREQAQLTLLKEIGRFYRELPFGAPDMRFNPENQWYSYCDAVLLFCMMRHFKPNRIVEIGSGYSSALMLDTNERFFDNRTRLTFIDPNPERLLSLARPGDRERSNFVVRSVQDVDLAVFGSLEENDFLFVDSSHVLKTGSDVNLILFEILPRLRRGVFIHFHDIFHPFEYPRSWVLDWWKGFAWNECYALKAFLMFNTAFEIQLFNTFLMTHHEKLFANEMPLCLSENQGVTKGASIWISRAN